MIKTILPQSTTEHSSSPSAVARFSRSSYSSPRSASPSPRSSRSLYSDLSRSPSPGSRSRSLSAGARSLSPTAALSPSGELFSPLDELSGYFPGPRLTPKPSPIKTKSKTVPAISVRPARISSSVNPRVLNRLRRKVATQLDEAVLSNNLLNAAISPTSFDISKGTTKSADSSPNLRRLRRSSSLKAIKTKICRTGSDGVSGGYEPIPPESDTVDIPRERIVSVSQAIRNKATSSKQHYRPMSLIPAANRIIHYDSTDESDGESSLDFANLSRHRVSPWDVTGPVGPVVRNGPVLEVVL